jgi:hypothetical protein
MNMGALKMLLNTLSSSLIMRALIWLKTCGLHSLPAHTWYLLYCFSDTALQHPKQPPSVKQCQHAEAQ